MSDRIELGISTPEGDGMTVRAYLDAAPSWRPHPEDSRLYLEAAGQEWLGFWNLGRFERLVDQLEAAADRLAGGHAAIVRSAVDDQPTVPYLLWEPADGRVAITLFFIEDHDLEWVYPPDERLDAYVAEHRETLVSGLPEDLREEAFEGVSLPFELTVTSLRREAALGRELLGRM